MAVANKTQPSIVKSSNTLKQGSTNFNATTNQNLSANFGIKRSSISGLNNSTGITQVPQNSATTNKMRKTASDF